MDLSGAFKTEVYRPVVTIVIPGVISLSPYVYIIGNKFPSTFQFAIENSLLANILALLAVIATGFILEDIGSRIEAKAWEPLQGDTETMSQEWYDYLRLAFTTEPLGQKYLGTVVMRMKFELAGGVAFLFSFFGLLYIKCALAVGFPLLIVLLPVPIGLYLLWESYGSSKLLRKLRHELLKGCPTISG